MQKAILCFRDYKDRDLISGITQGSKEGTHVNLNGANDWNGRNATDQVDLLAPYDCKVMAIAKGDNTCFFQSLEPVETPVGVYPCWFMCTHMNDDDFNRYGMKVGRVFKQGEACYTEGKKSGVGSVGLHIHMEQGTGYFKGGSLPYYKSNDVFYYGGKYYFTYYPNIKDGWEYPVYDMFFLKNVEMVLSQTEKNMGHKYYDGHWKFVNTQQVQVPSTSTGEKEVKELQDKVNTLTTENSNLSKQVKDLTTEKDKLTNQVKELTTEKDSFSKKIKDLISENTTIANQVKDLTAKIDNVKKALGI